MVRGTVPEESQHPPLCPSPSCLLPPPKKTPSTSPACPASLPWYLSVPRSSGTEATPEAGRRQGAQCQAMGAWLLPQAAETHPDRA